MFGKWVTVKIDEFEKVTYKIQAHSPQKHKAVPWLVCKNCGLVFFRNKFTQWAIRTGCYNDYHTDYKKMKMKFTKRRK